MKKIFILILGILMLSLVIAGGILESTGFLSKDKIDAIKLDKKVSKLEVQIGNAECTSTNCIVKVTGILNKEYKINAIKCIAYDYKLHKCLSQRPKTDEEIRLEIDNFVLNDLDNYAEELSKEEKNNGGILEIK